MTSCVRGYHVYGESWVAVLGEELHCEQEIGFIMDRYAVHVKRLGTSETEDICHEKYRKDAR